MSNLYSYTTNDERINAINTLFKLKTRANHHIVHLIANHIICDIPLNELIEIYLSEDKNDHIYQQPMLRAFAKGDIDRKKIFNKYIRGIEKEKKTDRQLKRRVVLHFLALKLSDSYKKRLFNYMVNSEISSNVWLSAELAPKFWSEELSDIYFSWFIKKRDDTFITPILKKNPGFIANRLKEIWNLKTRHTEYYRDTLISWLAKSHFNSFAFLEKDSYWDYLKACKRAQHKIPLEKLNQLFESSDNEKKMELINYAIDVGHDNFTNKAYEYLTKTYIPEFAEQP